MADLPQGRIAHFTSRRLRLRFPDKRGDDGFFGALQKRLSGWDSIERVAVNPLTGSLLVMFSDPAALFAENAAKNDLFSIDYGELAAAQEEPRRLADRAALSFDAADDAVRRWTGGGADLRGALFLALLCGGVYQLLRGNIAAPAATLLWYAGEMFRLKDPPETLAGAVLPPRGLAVPSPAAEG